MVTNTKNIRDQNRVKKDEMDVIIKFGGGENSSASEDDIDPRECVSGQNFKIDLNNRNFRAREPFDLLGTAPNGAEIRGFANLVDSDGVATILVQAGANVYKWSLSAGFSFVGTVAATAKLRGPLEHYWSLTDVVIITDINLVQPVMEWDGSALTTMTHGLIGDFKAKYCWVDDERARFANIISNSTATPHMIVTSELSDHTSLSISNRPSSSLGAADPYYLLTPDLRPVNGLMGLYDLMIVSSERGSIYKITGTDSTDTQIGRLFPRSFATGNESIIYVGNDILYGRGGRLESLAQTDKYGDVEVDDTTIKIKTKVADITDWEMAYNPRTQKVYVHPDDAEYMWQLSKDLLGTDLSPWVKLTTSHSSNLNPSAMMTMVDPDTNLEYVFWGDASGNLYRMEGTGENGDAGSADITTTWRSSIFKAPAGMRVQSFVGYISYRSAEDTEVTVKLLYGGSQVSDETTTVPITGTPGQYFWGGDIYWGGNIYWGVPFEGRFRRETIIPSGSSEEFQIEITHTGVQEIEVNEIGFKFLSASPA